MSDTQTSMQPETLTLTFRTPISVNGKDYDAIELREPTCSEVESMTKEKGDMAQIIKLIALVGGVPQGVVRGMRISELNEASQYLMGFMKAGPETGAS